MCIQLHYFTCYNDFMYKYYLVLINVKILTGDILISRNTPIPLTARLCVVKDGTDITQYIYPNTDH